jgi:hypothetical protein
MYHGWTVGRCCSMSVNTTITTIGMIVLHWFILQSLFVVDAVVGVVDVAVMVRRSIHRWIIARFHDNIIIMKIIIIITIISSCSSISSSISSTTGVTMMLIMVMIIGYDDIIMVHCSLLVPLDWRYDETSALMSGRIPRTLIIAKTLQTPPRKYQSGNSFVTFSPGHVVVQSFLLFDLFWL